MTSDNLYCYPADQLPNCLVAQTGQTHQCSKCAPGFILLQQNVQLGGATTEA